jgi:hypothetical protein
MLASAHKPCSLETIASGTRLYLSGTSIPLTDNPVTLTLLSGLFETPLKTIKTASESSGTSKSTGAGELASMYLVNKTSYSCRAACSLLTDLIATLIPEPASK